MIRAASVTAAPRSRACGLGVITSRSVPGMGASSSDRFRTVLATRAAALAVALALLTGAACGDDEEDEPQQDQTGETVDVPTSVQDTRTTLGGG